MTDRTANLLGVLALAVTERIEAAAREVLNHAGETPAAVVVIGYGTGVSNDQLRRILGLSHPGAVRLVDRLVAEGLAERRPGRDRRTLALRLTPAGAEVRERLMAGRLATIGRMLEPLSSTELDDFSRLLHRLLAAQETSEIERYGLCRLCDNRVCTDCPLPTSLKP